MPRISCSTPKGSPVRSARPCQMVPQRDIPGLVLPPLVGEGDQDRGRVAAGVGQGGGEAVEAGERRAVQRRSARPSVVPLQARTRLPRCDRQRAPWTSVLGPHAFGSRILRRSDGLYRSPDAALADRGVEIVSSGARRPRRSGVGPRARSRRSGTGPAGVVGRQLTSYARITVWVTVAPWPSASVTRRWTKLPAAASPGSVACQVPWTRLTVAACQSATAPVVVSEP